MSGASPEWLADAAAMPVAFAQVREDPAVDLAVVNMLERSKLSGIMVASGGCTAVVLAAADRFTDLHIVDMNPAQLALTRLKLQLLDTEAPHRRLALLGHLPMENRAAELTAIFSNLGLPADALGPIKTVAALGPDHAGRYELLFSALRSAMDMPWAEVLDSGSVDVAPGSPLGQKMDAAFDDVMALPNLIALFGAAATQNAVEPFARHFAARTRVAMATMPTATNAYLWQLLAGRFPSAAIYSWLTMISPEEWPDLTWTHAPFAAALKAHENRFDFVHLSNILDWLSPCEATEVLQLAHRALRPGGMTIIRQLNSTLDLPALGSAFDWQTEWADALHAADRSFFYRRLHIGRKQ